MLKTMPRIFAADPLDLAPRALTPAQPVAGLGRAVRCCIDGFAEAMKLLRTAPPLGDVGTRGTDLTAWVEAWDRQANSRGILSGYYRE